MPPAQIESTMAEFYRLYATSSAGAVAEEKKTLRHKITGRIRHQVQSDVFNDIHVSISPIQHSIPLFQSSDCHYSTFSCSETYHR